VISVCRGTACHVRGSERLVEAAQRELGIRDGETTEDLMFSLECVNCLGACALAPVVVVGGATYGKVTPERLRQIIEGYRSGNPPDAEATEGAKPKRKKRHRAG